MSTNSSQEISTNVVVYGKPLLKTITPTSGINAGKDVAVLNFRAFHPNYERDGSNGIKKTESDFYEVQMFGKKAETAFGHIKEGMTLEVRGSVSDHNFEKDGKQMTSHVILAKGIGLSLTQAGLRSVDFEKPAKQQEAGQEETQTAGATKQRAPAKKSKSKEAER